MSIMKFLGDKFNYIYGFLTTLLFISLPNPSPVVTNILLISLVGLLVIQVVRNGVKRLGLVQKIIIGFFLIYAVSVVLPSLFYENDYFNNKITRPLYFVLIPLLFFIQPQFSERKISKIKKYFVMSVVVFSFIGIIKVWYLYYLQLENKLFFDALAKTLKIHTTSFAYLTVLALAFVLPELWRKKGKQLLLYTSAALYLLLVLFLIATRIAFPAFVAVLLITLIYELQKKSYKRSILFLSLFAGLISIFLFNGYFSERIENITNANIENKTDIENRLIIWNCALDVFKNNPHKAIGLGINHSNNLLKECYYAKDFFGKDLGYHAHNQYLQTLISGGIIGFLGLCFFLSYLFFLALKTRNKELLMIVVIFAIFCLTEAVFEMQIGVTTFTIFISLFSNREKTIYYER